MAEHKDEEGYDDHKEITVQTLSTPPVRIEPAPLSKRIAAGLIDSVILPFGWVILMLSAGPVLSEIYKAFLTSSGGLYFALLVPAYFLMLGMFGAAIGKFALGSGPR